MAGSIFKSFLEGAQAATVGFQPSVEALQTAIAYSYKNRALDLQNTEKLKKEKLYQYLSIYTDPTRSEQERQAALSEAMKLDSAATTQIALRAQQTKVQQETILSQQAKRVTDISKAAREESDQISKFVPTLSKALRKVKSQDEYNAMRTNLASQASKLLRVAPVGGKVLLEELQNLPAEFNPEQLKQVATDLETNNAIYKNAPKTDVKRDAFIQTYLDQGYPQASAEMLGNRDYLAFVQAPKKVEISTPDKFGKTELQKLRVAIVNSKKIQALITAIKNEPDLERLFSSKISSLLAQSVDKGIRTFFLNSLGLSVSIDSFEGKLAKKRVYWNNRIEQAFNDYRTAVTGAAAAVAELEMLRATFPIIQGTYNDYLQKLASWYDNASSNIILAQEFLKAGGVNLQESNIDFSTLYQDVADGDLSGVAGKDERKAEQLKTGEAVLGSILGN